MAAGNNMKRFYKSASIAESDGRWCVELDGRIVKTPARAALAVPQKPLAEALAEEWERQGDMIDIQGMHVTRLVNIAIDRTPDQRDAMADELTRYCETDLLCFLAETPADLRARQIDQWRPVREWVGREKNIVLLEVPDGLLAAPQPPASLGAARNYALSLDDLALTGLLFGVGLFGSALLGIATSAGRLTAETAYEISILDELYQAEQWGKDEENEARLEANRTQAKALSVYFSKIV